MSEEEIKKFKEEILLNRECSGESNCIFVDDEEILQLINLIEKQQKEIENKDKKLKDIENHIKTELMMIEKCYNEVNLFSKQQYDGMMASYKCLLNIFFSEVEYEK